MRSLLRNHAPALVLALCAGVAALVAVLAEHIAWPMNPAFPWLRSGDFSYVATKSQWTTSVAARTIAWVSAVLAVLLLTAAGIAAAVLHRRAGRGPRP